MSAAAPTKPPRTDAFQVHRAEVAGQIELAYVHKGHGGVPLLMLHGWPSTKRIFYRNIAAMAAAGFEVIVPDAPGWGGAACQRVNILIR